MAGRNSPAEGLILGSGARIACLALAACGLVLSVVLTDGYYDHVVGGQVTGCSITSYIDCDKVSGSDFATVAGIPNSVYGFGFNLVIAGLILIGWLRNRSRSAASAALIVVAGAGTLVSLALAVISLAVIRALCIYCTMLQVTTVATFVVLVAGTKTQAGGSKESAKLTITRLFKSLEMRDLAPLAFVLVFAAAGGSLLFLSMERRVYLPDRREADSGRAGGTLLSRHFGDEAYEFATDDSPSMGSPDSQYQIVVFSDYNCTHCRDVDAQLQRLASELDGHIELVFKFFPLDDDCNAFIELDRDSTSCEAAAAAYIAFEQGKFWEYHERLFEGFQSYALPRLIEYAVDAGLDDPSMIEKRIDDEHIRRRMYRDILEGIVAGVTFTPTVFLNGRRIESYRASGDNPYELLKATIEELMNSG